MSICYCGNSFEYGIKVKHYVMCSIECFMRKFPLPSQNLVKGNQELKQLFSSP